MTSEATQRWIEARLKDFLRDNGVFKEENPDYAENLLKQHLHDILADMSQQMFTENRQRQQQVDNPQGIRQCQRILQRAAAVCGDALYAGYAERVMSPLPLRGGATGCIDLF